MSLLSYYGLMSKNPQYLAYKKRVEDAGGVIVNESTTISQFSYMVSAGIYSNLIHAIGKDGGNLITSSAIETAYDFSTNNEDFTQVTAGLRPTNNYDFDGSDWLTSPLDSDINKCTWFVQFGTINESAPQTFISMDGQTIGGSGFRGYLLRNSDGTLWFYINPTTVFTGITISSNDVILVCWDKDDSNLLVYKNGSLSGTFTNPRSSTWSTLRKTLGATVSGTQGFDGQILQFFRFSDDLRTIQSDIYSNLPI